MVEQVLVLWTHHSCCLYGGDMGGSSLGAVRAVGACCVWWNIQKYIVKIHTIYNLLQSIHFHFSDTCIISSFLEIILAFLCT